MAKNLEKWLIAKTKFRLSDKHIQMARELGLNPKKFGSLDNHDQEKWKAPLPIFIERIYFKRFKVTEPAVIKPVPQIIKEKKNKQQAKKQHNISSQNKNPSLPKDAFLNKDMLWQPIDHDLPF